MSETIGSFLGPGSQPAEEDGGVLDYMKMPSAMSTFAVPDLPEAEEIKGLDAAKAAMDDLLVVLERVATGGATQGAGNEVDLIHLDEDNLAFVNQVLGEGEVSVIGGNGSQAQEAVLAGVWRVRQFDGENRLRRDYVEVAGFPKLVLASAFAKAQTSVPVPGQFPANVFNAPPLLPEINEHIPLVVPGGDPHVINLSLLPHTEEDLVFLNDILGRGPVTILSRGYGNCRITATATRNVWWVQFYNSQDTLILNSIEITEIPEVACAAGEDIADSAQRLKEILEVYR